MADIPEIKVSHDSLIPLHVQLNRQLRGLIASGQYLPGSRLPSELQLQRELNISRNTIRQALRDAEHAGLIERIPGKGTFVAASLPEQQMNLQRMIAFVTCDFDCEFERQLLNGAEHAARACGYHIVFYNTKQNFEEESRLLRQLTRNTVGGIVLWSYMRPEHITPLMERSTAEFPPLVMMDRTMEGLSCDYVASDNYGGARLAVEHLLSLGHKHIVFLSHEMTDLLPVAERFQGYTDTLNAAGITPEAPWIIPAEKRELTPVRAMRISEDPHSHEMQYLAGCFKNQRPSAVFAINDHIALLALRAAAVAGLRVPDDVSIIGFDDLDFAPHLDTPLTSVAQNIFNIGMRSVELLMDRMEGYHGPPRWERLPVELRVRASTGRPTG